LLIGVTQLTSKRASPGEILTLAHRAKNSGLDGVVASAQEAAAIKQTLGRNFLVLTPGIRLPAGQGTDDQKRVTTFSEAIRNGADYAIVGRPILHSKDYLRNAESILST
jgi:orotidine-5'-phosphate decarboxylase